MLDVNILLALFDPLHPNHTLIRFWAESPSVANASFVMHLMVSHRIITDRYLFRLAILKSGYLLTLDAGIRAVDDTEQAALRLLRL